jgi:hypothetical protein
MSFINTIVRGFKFERHWSVRSKAETRLELLRSAPPVVFQVMHPALCDLPRIKEEAPVRVLVGGEFADEVCGSLFTWPDWKSHATLGDVLFGGKNRPNGWRDLPGWFKHRILNWRGKPLIHLPARLAEFVRPEHDAEYREWLDRRRINLSRDRLARPNLAFQAEEDAFIDMNWEVASHLGIRRAWPFFNRECLELAFDCHPAELVGPREKKLLRGTVANDVPHRNLMRGYSNSLTLGYLRNMKVPWNQDLPSSLEGIVRAEWFPRPGAFLPRDIASELTQLIIFLDHYEGVTRDRGIPSPGTASLGI